MTWNWQQPDWPNFTYDVAALAPLEQQFLLSSGEVVGAFRHISDDERDILRIELISDEALKTSEIEGEILDRASVQASLRRHFGLETDNRRTPPKEQGIAEMMIDLTQGFAQALSDNTLFDWHKMLMTHGARIDQIGAYRTHDDAMQIVSGAIDEPHIHFEAPPSSRVPNEMKEFIAWFNRTAPKGPETLPALTRAGIAHLYFESIHPFEDGNGRIGRALAEKSLAQNLGHPTLITLAYTIEKHRKNYYEALEAASKHNDITNWLIYFAQTILTAQKNTLTRVEFYIAKARFYDRFAGAFNPRQEKVIARLFRAGPEGFKGGLSAENYISITNTSRATATRDLQDLVEKQALTRTGERKHTRYELA